MKRLIVSLIMAMMLTLALAAPALAAPANVDNPNHCQNLANEQDIHGIHIAHGKADVVIKNLCT